MSFHDVGRAARYLIEELKARDFTLHYYKAITTDSIYMKFDYGVCNSLRISDHKGKKKYQFMFNINTARKGPQEVTTRDFTRYYYNGSKEQLNAFIEQLERHRVKKIDMLGYRGYLDEMKNQEYRSRQVAGFWSQAELIHVGTVPRITNVALEALNDGIIQW